MTNADHASVRAAIENSSIARFFPSNLELMPQLFEGYELELATCEHLCLDAILLQRNSGYFEAVDGKPTRHALMCYGQPVSTPSFSSSRLKSFFDSKQMKTGYATHGLFPYRGKFHPQMVKGILNSMGLRPGDTVVDPMMGSGTTLVEAAIMGLNAIGVDASPFCKFMSQVKIAALTMDIEGLRFASRDPQIAFQYMKHYAGDKASGCRQRLHPDSVAVGPDLKRPTIFGSATTHDILLLAYLDSVGYSERSSAASPYAQFVAVLNRYLFVVEKAQSVLRGVTDELGCASSLQGDARDMPIADNSADGILFSPPYSFAVDYIANDAFHLGLFGVDQDELRQKMIGLRGTNLKQKYDHYIADMHDVFRECSRILKPGGFCTIVVGTNSSQLSKVMAVSEHDVPATDVVLSRIARRLDFDVVRVMERQIVGISNSMRTERIVFLQLQ